MNYLPAFTLSELGIVTHEMEIMVYGNQYLLPYYPIAGSGTHETQFSDVSYNGNTDEPYTVLYYNYNYLQSGTPPYRLTGIVAEQELLYRAYVYDSYLNVPVATAEFLRQIITKQGFDRKDGNIISKVAQYIQNAAVYNLNYNASLDQEEDIVVAFLRDYKEGICRHYASAATLLFRMLGIPARYTIGYVGYTQAGQYVNVSSANAHAWVEVYLDGFGWLPIEVTGSFNGSDMDNLPGWFEDWVDNAVDAGEIPGGSLEDWKENLPEDWVEQLPEEKPEEWPEEFPEDWLEELPDIGDLIGGSGEGGSGSGIPDGNGTFEAQHITIKTGSAVKIYDGTPLNTKDYSITEGKLLSGHRLILSGMASQSVVGKVVNSYRRAKILDENGKDVTYLYYITKEFGTLEVRPRTITITTGSATASYESLQGGALTCGDFTQTGLLSEHQIEVYCSGWQQYPGKSENSVSFVVIYDRQGNDVTDCYAVELIYGTLRVT